VHSTKIIPQTSLLDMFTHFYTVKIYYYVLIREFSFALFSNSRSSDSSVVQHHARSWMIGGLSIGRGGNFSLHHHVHTGSGAHPTSYPVGTRGSFPRGKATEE
jgi:hypothetical protein